VTKALQREAASGNKWRVDHTYTDVVVGPLISGSEMSLRRPLRTLKLMALGVVSFGCSREAALVRKSSATGVPETLCSGAKEHFSCLPRC
jgi:hypothetical protein